MKSSTKKIVLSFNESHFRGELSKLQKKADQLTHTLSLVKKITDSKVDVLDLQILNNYLNKSTGFKNPMMSADALACKSEYVQIIASIPSSELPKYIELEADTYQVDSNSLKESVTNYMNEDIVDEYNDLVKLVEKLNKHDIHVLRGLNFKAETVIVDPLSFSARKQMR